MGQLLKHEGVCVWGEDTYKFASKMREKIPIGCAKSKYTDSQGNYLYYDAKPVSNGNITVGLYTDSLCTVEYQGSNVDAYTVTGYSEQYFEAFNEALDTWKICQPCIAYNLSNAYNNFYCYDEARYENCNQVGTLLLAAKPARKASHHVSQRCYHSEHFPQSLSLVHEICRQVVLRNCVTPRRCIGGTAADACFVSVVWTKSGRGKLRNAENVVVDQ